jgi:hypothetical protein
MIILAMSINLFLNSDTMLLTYLCILSDDTKNFAVKTKIVSADQGKTEINFCGKRVVYYEIFNSLIEADQRKKTIEGWPEKKIKFLVDLVNPSWEDWKKEINN